MGATTSPLLDILECALLSPYDGPYSPQVEASLRTIRCAPQLFVDRGFAVSI